jgi:uncharacterized delta-60 repeat protein
MWGYHRALEQIMRHAILGLMLAFGSASASASGQLDARFDGDGIRLVDGEPPIDGLDLLNDGVIDSAGRLVGAGGALTTRAIVLRLRANGTLDDSFGEHGRVEIFPPAGYSRMRWDRVVEQPDGKLLVGSSARETVPNFGEYRRLYVCRLALDGSLDPTFGVQGCAQPGLWPDSNIDFFVDMALQPDGRLVLLAMTDVDGAGMLEYTVARLEADGSRDLCFGDASCQAGGFVIEPEPNADLTSFEPAAIAVAPDGRIVLAGAATGVNSRDAAVIRLLPTGAVDVGFGNGGHRRIDFNQLDNFSDFANALAVDGNGRIFVAATVAVAFGQLTGVTALNANGNVIASFGDNGRRLAFFNDVSEGHRPERIRLQADGKLVVGGYTVNDLEEGSAADCGVIRLDADGDQDPQFGLDGKTLVDSGFGELPARTDECVGLALDERSIAVFGLSRPEGLNDDQVSLFIKLDQDDLFRDGFED